MLAIHDKNLLNRKMLNIFIENQISNHTAQGSNKPVTQVLDILDENTLNRLKL